MAEAPDVPHTRLLTEDDIDAETVSVLPERQALSKWSFNLDGVDNFAMPINEATAANIASTDSTAIADADQIVIINQVDQD